MSTRPQPDPVAGAEALAIWRGGALYRAEARAGVVRGDAGDPLREAVFFALLAWLPQLVLGGVEVLRSGATPVAVLLPLALEGAVRWLISAPLLFLGLRAVGYEIDRAVRHLSASGMLAGDASARLACTCRRLVGLRSGWGVELVLVALALGLGQVFGSRAQGLAGVWSQWLALPLFRYLVLRWLWQWLLWSALLWRISRLELQLSCGHPDGAAGLRFLARPSRLAALAVLGMSALLCAVWAGEVVLEGISLSSLGRVVAIYVVLVVAVILGPLCVLARPLARAVVHQYHAWDSLARIQTREFEARWLRDPAVDPGSSDFQGASDLGNVFARVVGTRLVPVTLRDLLGLLAAALLPLLPLVLLEIPLEALLLRLFGAMV